MKDIHTPSLWFRLLPVLIKVVIQLLLIHFYFVVAPVVCGVKFGHFVIRFKSPSWFRNHHAKKQRTGLVTFLGLFVVMWMSAFFVSFCRFVICDCINTSPYLFCPRIVRFLLSVETISHWITWSQDWIKIKHMSIVFFDFSLTVKATPHECVIRTGQP